MTDAITLKTPKGDFDYAIMEGSVGPEVVEIRTPAHDDGHGGPPRGGVRLP